MIKQNKDLIEIVKIRDQNKLLSELKTFFDTNKVSLTYKQFKTLLYSQSIYNRLKKAQIQEIWNDLKQYKQNKHSYSMSKEQLRTLREKTFHCKSLQEYQKKIRRLDTIGKIKTYNQDFTLDLNFLNDYEQTINSNKNFFNPFNRESIKYEDNTHSKNAFYFLEQNQDFLSYSPNTILLSQKNIYKLVRKQKANDFLGNFYNDFHLDYLEWVNNELEKYDSFVNWKNSILERNDIAKIVSHSYDFAHTLKFPKEKLNYEIISYTHIKDKSRIIDRGFYPTNTTRLLTEKYPFVNLGENTYDLTCKYYAICSKDNINQNCEYCNTMLNLKKRYTKKQRKSYLLSFDYLNNNNLGIIEYINDLEDKYPKPTEITKDKQMIYLKNVKLFDLNTFKPINAIKPKIIQSYRRTKHYAHLLRTNEDNDKAMILLNLALKKERKNRKRYRKNKSNKINLLNEFIKNIGKKEVFDLEDGSTLYLKDNLRDRRIRGKIQNITIEKKFNNQLKYLSDNIVYLSKQRDFNKHRKDIKKLEKKSKHYEDRVKVLKSDKAKIRNKKLSIYYKKKAKELKSIDFNRIIILQEYFFEHKEYNYKQFIRFFYDYLIKSDLSNLDKDLKDKIISLFRDYRNEGYNYIRRDKDLDRYFERIYDNCIFNVSKIIDL